MTSYVTSRDGTPIAFDRLGQGPPVVVVASHDAPVSRRMGC